MIPSDQAPTGFICGLGQYARAQLFYKMGTLRFRATWRSYYEKKGDSVSCPSHLCGSEVDSLDHAKVCKFLETKFDERKMSHPKEFPKYLVRLNQERFYGDCGLSN